LKKQHHPNTPKRDPKIQKTAKEKRQQEVMLYGKNAVRAVFKHRANGIIRAYVTNETTKEFADLLKWCAKNKLAYHVVSSNELETIASTVHHEGIAVLTRRKPELSEVDLFSPKFVPSSGPCLIIYFEGVGNPHNIGAIIRTCASFGVRAVVGSNESLPVLSAAAMRTAEGAAEIVEQVRVQNRTKFFAECRRKGFKVVGTICHDGKSLYKTKFAERVVLVLGAEIHGMDKVSQKECDELLSIPSTGDIDSLSVGVAAGIFMAEFARQRFHS
jgi:TrmH RNA methyltransferase